jgi:hypothetical protein
VHFNEPIVSRQQSVAGEVPLLLRYYLDNTNVTDFPIQLPQGGVLWRAVVVVTVAYNGTTPTIALGSGTGGMSDILTQAIPGVGKTDTLVNALLPASGKIYLNVTGASTAGAAQLMLMYAGKPAIKWT